MKKILLFFVSLMYFVSCAKNPLNQDVKNQSVEVKISSLTPLAQIVQISETRSTNDVGLIRFWIKANNASFTIKRNLSITLESSANLKDVVEGVRLKVNGQTLEVASPPALTSTVTFNNFDFNINSNDSVLVSISVDVKAVNTSGFPEGTTIQAHITNPQVKQITVYDQHGVVFSGNQIGFATGEIMIFHK